MRIAKLGFLLLIPFLLVSAFVAGQTSTAVPKITDLFSPEETKKAGLCKLDSDEISALNAAIFRIIIELGQNLNRVPRSKLQVRRIPMTWIFMTREDGLSPISQRTAT